eukprot:8978594-Ditylum_brightwellii.AAC.1
MPPGIQKITNMDEAMYSEGYDTDGDIEALVEAIENPVHNNNTLCQVIDDIININITAVDPGSFVLISDEDIDQMRVKDLQDELKKCGFVKRGKHLAQYYV